MLDLVNRRISSGEDMGMPRDFLQVATIISDGQRKMFAVAGRSGSTSTNTVEEWVEGSSSWKEANNVAEQRRYFGAVVVGRQMICPA